MKCQDFVTKASRHVHVVEHDDGPKSTLVNEPANKRENVDLVGDIKGRGRLIKEETIGVLRNEHREPDPLPLPHLKAYR